MFSKNIFYIKHDFFNVGLFFPLSYNFSDLKIKLNSVDTTPQRNNVNLNLEFVGQL